MLDYVGTKRQIRKWKKQRAERGFSDYDIYDIDQWFLKIMPEMLASLASRTNGFPSFLEEGYSEGRGLDCLDIDEKTKEKIRNVCFEKWKSILTEMEKTFREAIKETCSYKNKHKDEFDKACEEYENEYGHNGEKIKNNPYITHNPDGSVAYDTSSPYRMENIEKYKRIHDLYYEEEKKIDEYNEDMKKKALKLFVKYFDNLWW